MINVIWWVLRPFYNFGLIAAIPMVVLGAFNFKRDPEVATMVIILGLLYLALGYFMYVSAPKLMRRRLERRIEPFLATGFNPQHEAMSVLFNRYLGFDSVAKKVLYVDIGTGEVLMGFDQVLGWSVIVDKSPHPLLKLVTALPELREIGVRLLSKNAAAWKVDMYSLFGSVE